MLENLIGRKVLIIYNTTKLRCVVKAVDSDFLLISLENKVKTGRYYFTEEFRSGEIFINKRNIEFIKEID